jgi:hypothetical protein
MRKRCAPEREMLFNGEIESFVRGLDTRREFFSVTAAPMKVLSQSPNDCFWREADIGQNTEVR